MGNKDGLKDATGQLTVAMWHGCYRRLLCLYRGDDITTRPRQYGSETTNAVGVVRCTSCLRSGCSWCSLADSALFSRWAEAVEHLGPKFGSERCRVGNIMGNKGNLKMR